MAVTSCRVKAAKKKGEIPEREADLLLNHLTKEACKLKVGREPIARDSLHATQISKWVKKNICANFEFIWIDQ